LTKAQIAKALAHPLMLLVIGAIISSLLIPYFTRQWQDYQKELELKTDIAGEISKAISNVIITARFVQNPDFTNQMNFGSASLDWEISKAFIGSKIQSYFPNPQIRQDWKNLSNVITEFVQLNAPISQKDTNYDDKICLRLKHVVNTQKYIITNDPILAQNNPNNINSTDLIKYGCANIEGLQIGKSYSNDTDVGIDWNALVHKDLVQNNQSFRYSNSWLFLEEYIENRKNSFIQEILTSHIAGF
jgi:hypothetical protein